MENRACTPHTALTCSTDCADDTQVADVVLVHNNYRYVLHDEVTSLVRAPATQLHQLYLHTPSNRTLPSNRHLLI